MTVRAETEPRGGRSGAVAGWTLLVWLLGAALRTGPAGAAEEPAWSGRTVRAIRIESAVPSDEADLLPMLPLQVGEPVTPERVESARQRLMAKEVFERVDVDVSDAGDGAAVTVRLERRRVVNSIDADGYAAIRRREVWRLIRIHPGEFFSRELAEGAVERLRARYRKLGFDEASVAVDVSGEGIDADLTFRIEEGVPLRVAAAEIDGAPAELLPDLQKRLRKLEGKTLSREREEETQKTLQRVLRRGGYYEARVRASRTLRSGKDYELRYTVQAGPPVEIEFDGNTHLKRRKLLDLVDFEKRLIVTDGTWRELATRMTEEYVRHGFYHARVGVEIDDGPPKRVRFRVDEGRRYVIGEVRFQGNRQLSDGELAARMETAPWVWLPWPRRGVLVDSVLDDDLRRIWWYYREKGYESAEVVDAVRRPDDAAGRMDLTIVVDEGPRTVVRECRREGLDAIEPAVRWKVTEGEPFDARGMEADGRLARQLLGQAGYVAPAVRATVEREPAGEEVAARVTLRAEPGPQSRVGAVVVQGNVDTKDRVIVREVALRRGDPLNTEKLVSAQNKLYRLGLFRSVFVRPLDSADGLERDVAVRVVERPAGRFDWGGGYNTRDGIIGFVEAGYDNIGGMARRFSVRGHTNLDPHEWKPTQYLANATYREPRLFDSPWRFTESLVAERTTESIDPYSIERADLVSTVDREVWQRLQVGCGLSVERADLFDVEPDVVLSGVDEGTLHTVALGPFLVHDGRDDPFAPTRGVFESVNLRYALPALSTQQFVKVNVKHGQYVPLGEHLSFLYSARGGWAKALESGAEIPISERYFLGGRDSVRGFSENSIGPTGADGHAIGGDFVVNLSGEFRVPVGRGFAVAVFSDGGGVFLLSDSLSLHDFRKSAGFGLRYMTPVGPLSLDYGIKLDRRSDESFGEFHFSVGAAF